MSTDISTSVADTEAPAPVTTRDHESAAPRTPVAATAPARETTGRPRALRIAADRGRRVPGLLLGALTRTAAVAAVALLWEAAPRLGWVDRTFLPPFSQVV